MHQMIWTEWSIQSIPLGWLVTILCVAHIFTYGKHKLIFSLAVLTSALWYFSRQPFAVNHLYFETIMSLLMSAVIIAYYINKKNNIKLTTLPDYFALHAIPLLRSCLIILYFFVVLHKLNYDFFKTEISCGAVLFENLVNNLRLTKVVFIEYIYDNNQTLISNFSIYTSLIAELLIPILLLFRRSRNFGLVFAMLFHFVLAMEGLGAIVSFTAMMFTYLILFSSVEMVDRVIETTQRYSRYLSIGAVIAVAMLSISYLFFTRNIFNMLVGLTWVTYIITTIIFYISHIKLSSKNSIKLSSPSLVLWIFPLLVFINGFAPYLGLKTQTSFSMFSNLITENGRTNHFFIPSDFQIFNYQKELVYIEYTNIKNISSPDAWNKDRKYNLLLFEFIRKINSVDSGYVKFNVNDKSHYIEKKNGEVVKSTIELHQNRLLKKLLLFRPVYSENISYCQQ